MNYYQSYTTVDFVSDKFFQEWVRNPTEETRVFWESFYEENVTKQAEIDEAKKVLSYLLQSEKKYTPDYINDMWTNISTVAADRKNSNRMIKKLYPDFLKIAAVITLLVVAGSLLWMVTRGGKSTNYHSGYGQLETVVLPDSSTVTLNANSTITWNLDEKNNAREIWIDGEAYFSVRKSSDPKSRKFIVHTKKFDIEVLGTSFNVNSRRNSAAVVLNSGKIKLKSEEITSLNEKYMHPGDLIEVKEDGNLSSRSVNPDHYNKWMKRQLNFYKTPVKDIAKALEDLYGYQIEFDSPQTGDLQFTVDVAMDTNTPDLLFKLLQESLNLRVIKDEKEVIIKQK